MRDGCLSEAAKTEEKLRLRPLVGWDEMSVDIADTSAAFKLLARLAINDDGSPAEIEALTVSRCDRLIAELYYALYGKRAQCRVRCASCNENYEFDLALPDIILAQDSIRPHPPAADGAWTIPDGRRVRAPLIGDIWAAGGPEALLERLVVAGDPATDRESVIEFLERAAPVLSIDLDAACPHCGKDEIVRFDLARYLAQRLAGERAFLVRETHLIASRYGWTHTEIMSLTRQDRRAYAGLIEAERASGLRRRAG
jgi:hypothetical protein